MLIRWKRVWALIVKEFQVTLADKNNRMMILLPPILQLVLFAYTATLEVNNVSMAIYDKDNTQISRNLSKKFENTKVISKIFYVNNQKDMKNLMDKEKVYIVLTIPQDFSKNIYNGNGSSIQLLLDGRRSNASQIVSSYATNIISLFGNEINDVIKMQPKINLKARSWFNPNLNYQWFITVCLTGILAMTLTFMITSLAVAQEKELGTFDQIIVSPLKSSEILIGKTIPAILITLFDVTVMILGAILFFKVPLAGSILALYTCIIIFLLCMSGIGLTISVLCKTQQQAVLGVFMFTGPVLLLSGFMTPIENMPVILQKFSALNPLTYFFFLIKGIFLRDISNFTIWQNCYPLAVMAIITLTFSWWFFNKKLD